MSSSHSWSYYNPVRIVYAPLDALAQHVNAQHVLLVTTPGFVRRGVVRRVQDILSPRQVTVWDGVKPNPDLQDLDAAAQLLRSLDIACVVGLGGGSAIDAAKVLATITQSPAKNSLSRVFRDKEKIPWSPRLPLVAIPTTSGTGAEVTPFATVWDHEYGNKYSLTGGFIYPDVALLDPTLTLTLGYEETLYPALDAISHALESLWNKNRTPISQTLALRVLSMSNIAFPAIIKNNDTLDCRRDLQVASTLAGLAISQTRTAIAHAISYHLTLAYGVPHGLACSFTLPIIISAFLETDTDLNNHDKSILFETRSILLDLELKNRVKRYMNEGDVFSRIINMSEGRIENYIGPLSWQQIVDEV